MADCIELSDIFWIARDVSNNSTQINNADALRFLTRSVDNTTSVAVTPGVVTFGHDVTGVTASPTATFSPVYNGTSVDWVPKLSTDADNDITLGTDGGLFLDMSSSYPSPLFTVSRGTTIDPGAATATFNTDVGEGVHFYSDGSIELTLTDNAAGPVMQVSADISSTAGNQLTLDGNGLFVPASSETITSWSVLNGVYTNTLEDASTYDIDTNANALRAVDTNDILGGGPGAISDVQTLLDAIEAQASSPETLTTISYDSVNNRITYVDEAAGSTVMNLNSSTISISGTTTPTISTSVSGTGTSGDPFLVTSVLRANLADLQDVTSAAPASGEALVWNGSQWAPTAVVTGSTGYRFISNVSLSGNSLVFSANAPGPFTGSVDLTPIIPSYTDSYVSNVSLSGTDLVFLGTGSSYVGSVDLSTAFSAATGFTARDKALNTDAVADGATWTVSSAETVLTTDVTTPGSLFINFDIATGSANDVLRINGAGTGVEWGTPSNYTWDLIVDATTYTQNDTNSVTIVETNLISATASSGAGNTNLTLGIDTTGASANDVASFDGANVVWASPTDLKDYDFFSVATGNQMLSSESGDPMYTESIVHFGSSTGPAIRTAPGSSSLSWGKSDTATALGSNEVSIGSDAGNGITKDNAVMIGANAGSGIAAAGQDFVLVGTDAARAVTSGIGSSVAIGHQAGESAASIDNSILIGWNVAKSSLATFDSSSSVIIGKRAGDSLTANQVIAIGEDSMYLTTGTPTSTVAIGQSSGTASTAASGVYLGKNAGKENTGNSVVAIGTDAGYDGGTGGNSLSSMFIIANTHLPSYANHAAAAAAITTGTGGRAGNTYLYHNQATDSIGAVRL